VLDALAYAHERGVVHRDLKPDNIIVIPGRGPSPETVKLLDFGIARLGDHSDKAAQKLTQQGLLLGTPDYMSPEQAVGQGADPRSDLYSCGVILYQMLTGHRPFEGDSSVDVLVMHVNARPKRPREIAPGAVIPAAMEQAILRVLAKRPKDRFQSARDLRQALERAAVPDSRVIGATRVQRVMRAAAPVGSRRRQLLIPSAIIAAAMATSLGHHWQPGLVGHDDQLAPSEATLPDRARPEPADDRPAREVRKARAGSKRHAGFKR